MGSNRPLIVGLLALLVVSAFLNSGPLLLLTVLLSLTSAASAIWGRFALKNVTYQRQFGSQRLSLGEQTDLWVEIVNAKVLPLAWLRVDDEWPHGLDLMGFTLPPSGRPRRQLLTNLLSMRWYERVRRHYQVQGLQRGRFLLGPVRLTSGDMFGFRSQTIELPDPQYLIVHPQILALSALGLRHARPFGDLTTRRALYADPLKLAGARQYAPGDNPRHLHWKATARRGSLHTRVFDPGAEPQVLLFLNIHTNESGYQGTDRELFERTISVAASIANAALDQRMPTGLMVNGNQPNAEYYARLPAGRSPDQLLRILDTLAGLTYISVTPFESLLRSEARSLPYGASVVVVSALANEPTLAALLQMHLAGHPITFISIGATPFNHLPAEFDYHHIDSVFEWTADHALKLG